MNGESSRHFQKVLFQCVKTRQIPGVVPRLRLGRNSADRTMSNIHGKAPGSSTPELRAQAGAELPAWG